MDPEVSKEAIQAMKNVISNMQVTKTEKVLDIVNESEEIAALAKKLKKGKSEESDSDDSDSDEESDIDDEKDEKGNQNYESLKQEVVAILQLKQATK